jgi:hypothetical protein
MGRATDNITPEQQELLDSGLRMLAHMIAETHLRRTVLRKTSESTTHLLELTEPTRRRMREKSSDENLSEDNDE